MTPFFCTTHAQVLIQIRKGESRCTFTVVNKWQKKCNAEFMSVNLTVYICIAETSAAYYCGIF